MSDSENELELDPLSFANTNDWTENRDNNITSKAGDLESLGYVKVDISWEIKNGKIDPLSFDSSGFLTKTDDLRLYHEQKANSRKKWQDLEEARKVIKRGYAKWSKLQETDPDDRSQEDKNFLESYSNYTRQDWLDSLDSADAKVNSAQDTFHKVRIY